MLTYLQMSIAFGHAVIGKGAFSPIASSGSMSKLQVILQDNPNSDTWMEHYNFRIRNPGFLFMFFFFLPLTFSDHLGWCSSQAMAAGADSDAVGVPRSVPVRVAHELLQAGHRYLDVRLVRKKKKKIVLKQWNWNENWQLKCLLECFLKMDMWVPFHLGFEGHL